MGMESNSDKLRQKLKAVKYANSELEQLYTDIIASVAKSENKERLLLAENENLKKDKKRMELQILEKTNELAKIKWSLKEKDIQIELKERKERQLLAENKNLIEDEKKMKLRYLEKSNELTNMKLELSDVSKPSTSSQTRNSIATPSNHNNMFENIIEDMQELLERQLQCAICNEVYINTVAVKCGHMFCEACMSTWMETKKSCPLCRTQVTATFSCKAIDSYVSKFIETFASKDYQNSRKALIDQVDRKSRSSAERISLLPVFSEMPSFANSSPNLSLDPLPVEPLLPPGWTMGDWERIEDALRANL